MTHYRKAGHVGPIPIIKTGRAPIRASTQSPRRGPSRLCRAPYAKGLGDSRPAHGVRTAWYSERSEDKVQRRPRHRSIAEGQSAAALVGTVAGQRCGGSARCAIALIIDHEPPHWGPAPRLKIALVFAAVPRGQCALLSNFRAPSPSWNLSAGNLCNLASVDSRAYGWRLWEPCRGRRFFNSLAFSVSGGFRIFARHSCSLQRQYMGVIRPAIRSGERCNPQDPGTLRGVRYRDWTALCPRIR